MKNKKTLLKIGSITSLAAVPATVISCVDIKGRKIELQFSPIDEWIMGHEIAPYIQNNDQPGTSSLDVMVFNIKEERLIGDVFDKTFNHKIYSIATPEDMKLQALKDEFARVNIQISNFLKKEPVKNQFMVFYKNNIGRNIEIRVKKLLPPKSNEFAFLNNVQETYDFNTNTTEEPHKNNGVPIRMQWWLKEKDSKSMKWITEKEKADWDNETWQGFTANRMGSKKEWEKKWAKNPVNLLTYPYIDYNEHVMKVMTIAFDGGYGEEIPFSASSVTRIRHAKRIKYKISTIKNMLPLSQTVQIPTTQQKAKAKEVIGLLKKWIVSLGGPQVLQMALGVTIQILPELQMTLENINEFTNEFSKQIKAWEGKNRRNLSIKETNMADLEQLPILNPSNISSKMDDMVDSLSKNYYDFTKIDTMLKYLKGENTGNDLIVKMRNKKYSSFGSSWAYQLDREDQFFLTYILLTMKYISPEWVKLK